MTLVRSTTNHAKLIVATSAAIVIVVAASACGSTESAVAPTSTEAGVEGTTTQPTSTGAAQVGTATSEAPRPTTNQTVSAVAAGGVSDGEEAYVATVRARIAPTVFHGPDESLLSHGRRACGEFDEATESAMTTERVADDVALAVFAFEEAEAAALLITIDEAVFFLCDEHQETWDEIQDLLGIDADTIALPPSS